MTWTAWRLSRSSALATLGLVAVATTFLLWSGHGLRDLFTGSGLAACLGSGPSADCSDAAFALYEHTRTLAGGQPVVGFLSLLPGVLGAFLGGPLVAREIETGTLRLAWTQSVTRERWLSTRTLVAAAIVVLGMGALTAALSYWRWPLDQLDGRLEPNAYDVQGLVPTAYAVLALCVGVAVGAVTRRVAVAIGTTLGVVLLLRVVVETAVRPHLMTPVTVSYTGDRPPGLDSQLVGAWVLEQRVPRPGSGFPDVVAFHPADRFWPFQLMETGLLLLLAAVALAVAFWWVRSRVR